MENVNTQLDKMKTMLDDMKGSLSRENVKEDSRDGKVAKVADKSKEAIDEMEKKVALLSDKIKEMKKKYNNMDDKKKKRLWAGVGASVAMIAALVGAKKIKDKINEDK